ncbi:MAG TPA: hypothetical protein VLH84_02035 [Patescibacteria group bacterium]|nr:hypothetical protein [Patescibacteria group bacterium]
MKNKTISFAISNKALQMRGILMLGFLAVQFVVGMTLDLFIKLPDSHPGTTGSFVGRSLHGYAWAVTNGGGAALTVHIVVASILVLGSIATLGFSIAAKHKAWIIASSVGLVGVWLSFLNGLEFINTNIDKHSMAMAMEFMIAFVAYGVGVYAGKGKR